MNKQQNQELKQDVCRFLEGLGLSREVDVQNFDVGAGVEINMNENSIRMQALEDLLKIGHKHCVSVDMFAMDGSIIIQMSTDVDGGIIED